MDVGVMTTAGVPRRFIRRIPLPMAESGVR
jgi:hypothetical protein